MTTSDDAGRIVPLDLVAIIGTVLLSSLLTYWSFGPLEPFRILLGLVSVLFAPGYVTLVAVVRNPDSETESNRFVWPRLPDSRKSQSSTETTSGLGQLEWGVLSVLTSVAIVSLLGLLLSFVSLGVTPRTMVFSVNGYAILLAVTTAIRRLLFGEGRTGLSLAGVTTWVERLRHPPTSVDAFLNLLLVFLLVAGGLVVVAPTPGHTPQFTEFTVLTETTSNDVAMQGYLSGTDPNETERLRVGITNHEHRRVNYTVVVQVQRATVTNRSVRVLERRRISEFTVELAHNESVQVPYEFTASEAESGCRVVFLLYTGDVPRSPTIENSYRELHVWHTVSPPDEGPSCPTLDVIDTRVNRTELSN